MMRDRIESHERMRESVCDTYLPNSTTSTSCSSPKPPQSPLHRRLRYWSLFHTRKKRKKRNVNTKKESKWDENITTKIDVQTFWKQVKETREIKYGKDDGWDKNMDYCSYWSENIALTKGEGLVMSNLIKYADKCMNTLNFMTKYMLDENAEYKE